MFSLFVGLQIDFVEVPENKLNHSLDHDACKALLFSGSHTPAFHVMQEKLGTELMKVRTKSGIQLGFEPNT